ncbi:MAG: hypothetical protein ACX93T_04330, partial [Bacteroidota bacterium]
MLKLKRNLSVAAFLWLSIILPSCSRSMVDIGEPIVDREQEARGGFSQNRMEPDIGTPNNSGVGAIHHATTSSGHGAMEDNQQVIVASGNVQSAAVMSSPHDTADGRVAGDVVNNEGAFVHVAAQSGQDASVGDQESGAAGGRADIASQQEQSIPYPIVYGGYRAFGAQAWRDYFGVDVGTEPALPSDIVSILNEEVPFILDSEKVPQRVADNHLLTLIPSYVTLFDGRHVPFTLDQLGALVKARYFPNNEDGYKYYDPAVRAQFGAESPNKSYWLLMTRDVLRGTRQSTYVEQQETVEAHSSKGWMLPSGLEAATSIL